MPKAKPKPLIGAGDLIVESWANFKSAFGHYLTFATWLAALALLHWLLQVTVRWLIADRLLQTLINLFITIPITVGYLLITVAVIDITARSLQGKKVDMRERFYMSLHYLVPFIWVGILTYIATGLGLVMLIIPGLIFFVWLKFSVNHVIVDDVHGMAALSASKRLVVGRWWSVAFRVLIPLIFFTIAASFALKLGYLLLGATFGDPGLFFGNVTISNGASNGQLLVTSVLPKFVHGFTLALLAGADLLLWFDLKRTT